MNLIADPVTASYAKQADSSDRAKGPVNLLLARPVVGTSYKRHDDDTDTLSVTGPLRTNAYNNSDPTMKIQQLVTGPLGGGNDGIGRRSEDDPNLVYGRDLAHALGGVGGGQDYGANKGMGRSAGVQEKPAHAVSTVRRLTPTETELLQGFPPGFTCLCGVEPYATMTCRCPDSARYRAMGNAVTVPVILWLGRRLLDACS